MPAYSRSGGRDEEHGVEKGEEAHEVPERENDRVEDEPIIRLEPNQLLQIVLVNCLQSHIAAQQYTSEKSSRKRTASQATRI